MEVCRLCLDLITTGGEAKPLDGEARDMVRVVAPEVNLELTKDPMMCETCRDHLQKLRHFRSSCQDVEDRILDYCEQNGISEGQTVDLHAVLEADLPGDVEIVSVADDLHSACSSKDVEEEMLEGEGYNGFMQEGFSDKSETSDKDENADPKKYGKFRTRKLMNLAAVVKEDATNDYRAITWSIWEKSKMRHCFKDDLSNREVPSVAECQKIQFENDELRERTAAPLQTWLGAEILRDSSRRRSRWTTPIKEKCRQYFRRYYKGEGHTKYPSQKELREACGSVAEFEGLTPNLIRSHLQHDMKYLSRKAGLS